MSAKIQDQFADLTTKSGKPMSRQQLWMVRKRALGLCRRCGEKADGNSPYCLSHKITVRERQRKKHGYRRRNRQVASYAGQNAKDAAAEERFIKRKLSQREIKAALAVKLFQIRRKRKLKRERGKPKKRINYFDDASPTDEPSSPAKTPFWRR